MKVRAYFSYPTTHLLTDENNALCGTKLNPPFGNMAVTLLFYHQINCKKCRKKFEKMAEHTSE